MVTTLRSPGHGGVAMSVITSTAGDATCAAAAEPPSGPRERGPRYTGRSPVAALVEPWSL